MKQQVKNIANKTTLMVATLAALMALMVGSMLFLAPEAGAQPGSTDLSIGGGANAGKSDDVPENLIGDDDSIFTIVVNVLLFLVGAVSVIMLIFGGIKYTISNGDPGAVTKAKDTILYAVIGIIVAILAYALVNFVISAFISN